MERWNGQRGFLFLNNINQHRFWETKGSAFTSGGAGYTARTAISSKETFTASHMLIEAGANTASGMLSFAGGMGGGIGGVKVPGSSTGIGSFAKYHAGMTWFGVYPSKGLISAIKNALKGKY